VVGEAPPELDGDEAAQRRGRREQTHEPVWQVQHLDHVHREKRAGEPHPECEDEGVRNEHPEVRIGPDVPQQSEVVGLLDGLLALERRLGAPHQRVPARHPTQERGGDDDQKAAGILGPEARLPEVDELPGDEPHRGGRSAGQHGTASEEHAPHPLGDEVGHPDEPAHRGKPGHRRGHCDHNVEQAEAQGRSAAPVPEEGQQQHQQPERTGRAEHPHADGLAHVELLDEVRAERLHQCGETR